MKRSSACWKLGSISKIMKCRLFSGGIFAGQCPVTDRAWKAGNRQQTVGPDRFATAMVKLEFIEQTFPVMSLRGGPEGADVAISRSAVRYAKKVSVH